MPVVKIPSVLSSYFNGQTLVQVEGSDAGQALENLMKEFPAIRPHITNDRGQLRPFVNLYLGENNIKELNGMKTPLHPEDILQLVPSVAGG
jgi:sulfur-carrier protein